MSRTSVALSVSTGHLRLFAIAHFGCVRHLTSVTMRNRIATLARRKCAKTVSLRGGDQWLAAWHGCAIQPHPFIRVHSTGASNQSNLSLLRVGNTRNALRACRVCGTVLGCECMISRILVSMFHRCRMSQPFSRAAGNAFSSREKGCSGAARSIPFLLLPFRSKPLKLPLPGLELIRSAPVGGRGLLMKELLCVMR